MRTASKLASAAVFVAFLVLGQVWLLACSVAAIKAVEVLFGDGELQRKDWGGRFWWEPGASFDEMRAPDWQAVAGD